MAIKLTPKKLKEIHTTIYDVFDPLIILIDDDEYINERERRIVRAALQALRLIDRFDCFK